MAGGQAGRSSPLTSYAPKHLLLQGQVGVSVFTSQVNLGQGTLTPRHLTNNKLIRMKGITDSVPACTSPDWPRGGASP